MEGSDPKESDDDAATEDEVDMSNISIDSD